MNSKTKRLSQAAVVAALYYVLTGLIFPLISYMPTQLRVAEGLMLLPAIMPATIPGLFIGCLLSNLLNPNSLGPIDIIFGSLATLLAAWLTFAMAKKWLPNPSEMHYRNRRFWLLPLPTILCNTLIVGVYLPFLLSPQHVTATLVLLTMGGIALGEALATYGLGLPLLYALRKAIKKPL